MPHARRRTLVALPAVAIAAVAALAAPAASPAAKATPGCFSKGTQTVAINRLARVYVSADEQRLYGCVRSVGRPLLLEDEIPDDLYASATFAQVTLAGRVVGWFSTHTDVSCKADCPPDYDTTTEYVNVADLRARRARVVAALSTSVAVSTRGSLAWTQAAGDQSEIHLSKARGDDTLVDSGQITELAFRSDLLLWRNAGQGRWVEGH